MTKNFYVKSGLIFGFLVMSISYSSSAPTCGSYTTYSHSAYGATANLHYEDAYGKACTRNDAVNYAEHYAKCDGSGSNTLYVRYFDPDNSPGCSTSLFDCSYGGCSTYDQRWGTNSDVSVKSRTSSGEIKDAYWLCYSQTGSGAAWQAVCNYGWDEVNQQANNPSSPSPNNGETNVNPSPTISVDVSDPDGDNLDVVFRDGSGDYIDTDYNVPDRGTASTTWNGADSMGTTYNWYAVAEDDPTNVEVQSSTYSFTTVPNNPPDSPVNIAPGDNQDEISTSPDLEVHVDDNDNDMMDVKFYTGSGDYIDTDSNVCSSCTASVDWNNLNTGSSYSWYAVADDGNADTRSGTWSFDTESEPNSPNNPSPFDGEDTVSTSTDLDVDVSHPDGDSMNVRFYDGGGDYIDTDFNVCDGCTASVSTTGESIASNTGSSYSWYAVSDDGSRTERSSTWSFDTVSAPNNPSNPSPTGDSVFTTEDLEAKVSHPDGLDMDVTFRINDGSGWGTIRTVNNVGDGQTVSANPNLNAGQQYDWKVIASAAGHSTTSNTWTFSTIEPPSQPSLRNPSPDGVSTVPTSDNLKAKFTHPDGLDMNVAFYLDDGSGFDKVGSTNEVSDGTTESRNPGLDTGTEYTWYAKAESRGFVTESNRWDFETNYIPEVDQAITQDKTSGHSIEFKSLVSDQDGRNDIRSCTVRVSDGSGNVRAYNADIRPGNNARQAECIVDQINYQDENWDHLQDLDLELTVEDNQGRTDTSSTSEVLPNHAPVVEDFEITDYDDREAFKAEWLVRAADADSSEEINSCNIEIIGADRSFSAGDLNLVNSTHVKCVQDDIGPETYNGLTLSDELKLKLNIADVHGKSTLDTKYYRFPSGIEFDYTSIVMPQGGVEFLDFQVSNDGNGEASYESEIENINATFTGSGQETISYDIQSGSSESLDIKLTPDVNFTGTKNLKIVTENTDSGIEKEHTIEVTVRETPRTSEVQIPGVELIHLFLLMTVTSLVFMKRKEQIL